MCSTFGTHFPEYVEHFYEDLDHLWLETCLNAFLSWCWNKKAITENRWIKIPALFTGNQWVLSPMLNLDVHCPSSLYTWTLIAEEGLTERSSE